MGEFTTDTTVQVDAAMGRKTVFHGSSSLVLACVTGLEPVTCRLEVGCSIQLSYTQNVTEPRRRSGGSSRIRTCGGFPPGALAKPCHKPLDHGSLVSGGKAAYLSCHSVPQRSITLLVLTGLTWSWEKGLNLRPDDYRSPALPTELPHETVFSLWHPRQGSNLRLTH